MTKNISINLLKHISPSAFLEKYWGKQALFLQDAIDISGAELSKDVVFGLAKNENIESKIIAFIGGSQQTTYGPFNKVRHAKSSSLLIHQFNLIHEFSYNLFQSINFVPYCLHDDVMMSFSSEGGGVGPHSDSYDVFLVQGQGEKVWNIGATDKKSFETTSADHSNLKFTITEQFVAKPGDILYVPPFTPHHGISLSDDCVTYSIGFRSPSNNEIRNQYLEYLMDRKEQSNDLFNGLDLSENTKALIPNALASFIKQNIAFPKDRLIIDDFIGCFLSEPHEGAFFTKRNITKNAFKKIDIEKILRLNIQTRAVIHNGNFYINAENIFVADKDRMFFEELFNQKQIFITPSKANDSLVEVMIYLLSEGYITFNKHRFML